MTAPVPPQGSLSPEIAKLTKKLAEDPRSKVFLPLAEEYVRAGLLQEAALVLEEGLKIYPTFITALVALGRVYLQLDVIPKAQAMLEEVIKHSPENLLAHRILARIYVETDAFDQAKKSCSLVLNANPKDEDILALLTQVEQKGTEQAHKPSEVVRDEWDVAGLAGAPTSRATFQLAKEPHEPTAQPTKPASGPRSTSKAGAQKIARLRGVLENIRQRRG